MKRIRRLLPRNEQRLKRLRQVYRDGLVEPEAYRRQKRELEETLGSFVSPPGLTENQERRF